MQVFNEVCSNCHSLQYIAFRNFRDLGYNEAQVRNLAAGWRHKVATIGPDGSPAERTGLPADRIPNPFPNEAAARNANGNALPPDLTLMVRAREGGAPYIYSLLTGYRQLLLLVIAFYLISAWLLRRRRVPAVVSQPEKRVPAAVAEW